MDALADFALPLAAGLALAAAAGLRAFLPLAVLGAASRLGWITLSPGFAWLASPPALLAFGSATLIELLGDKIPVVDHALDAIGTVLRPVAGAVALAAVTTGLDPLWQAILAIAVGGGAAGAVHLGKAHSRLGSSLLSFGIANPILSAVEDILAAGLALLAVLLPLLALGLLALFAYLAYRLMARLARTLAGRPEGQPVPSR